MFAQFSLLLGTHIPDVPPLNQAIARPWKAK